MKKVLALLLVLSMVLSLGITSAFADDAVTGTGTAQGRNGPVTVKLTFDGDTITDVEIVESHETVGVSDAAQEIIPARIVEYQTTSLDAVSGATLTSAALRLAAEAAIKDAGKDPSNYKEKVPAHEAVDLEDMDCDIVVVGGGIAGLMSAITAKAEGAGDVILIEKHAEIGGSAALSSAFMVTAEYDKFEAENPDYDDSLEKVLDGLRATAELGDPKYVVNWDYLEKIERAMPETLDFLFDLGLTAKFRTLSTAVTAWDGQGAGFMKNLGEIAEKQGITILTGTTGTELLTDESGAVCGVKAISNGDNLNIYAKKVILATGGSSFAKGAVFDNKPADSQAIFFQGASTGDTGDGQVMAAAVGAEILGNLRLKQAGIEYNQTLRNSLVKKPSTDGLIVNAEGQRFANEKQPSNQMLTDIMLFEGSPRYFLIVDTADAELAAALKDAYDKGLAVFYGETIEDLATAIKIDPATLRASFDRYQSFCETGVDEDFGKQVDKLVPYTGEAGYYAINIFPAGWGTMGGGIKTDDTGHVLTADDSAINNLFAAGEVSDHDIFGQYYVGGMSMSTFAAAGHIAGRTAAQELAE
jgi:succinate dehydrogenase/fumarate reductase flavoprotein subunit